LEIDSGFGLYGLGEPLDPCQAPVPPRGHASHRFGGIVESLGPDRVAHFLAAPAGLSPRHR
jgi:hypothetical protein